MNQLLPTAPPGCTTCKAMAVLISVFASCSNPFTLTSQLVWTEQRFLEARIFWVQHQAKLPSPKAFTFHIAGRKVPGQIYWPPFRPFLAHCVCSNMVLRWLAAWDKDMPRPLICQGILDSTRFHCGAVHTSPNEVKCLRFPRDNFHPGEAVITHDVNFQGNIQGCAVKWLEHFDNCRQCFDCVENTWNGNKNRN